MLPTGPSHNYFLNKLGLTAAVEGKPRTALKKGGSAKRRAGGGAMPQTSGGMQQPPSSDMGQTTAGPTVQTNPIQSKPVVQTPKQFSGYVSRPTPTVQSQPLQNANQQPQTQSFNDPNAQNQPNAQLRKGGRAKRADGGAAPASPAAPSKRGPGLFQRNRDDPEYKKRMEEAGARAKKQIADRDSYKKDLDGWKQGRRTAGQYVEDEPKPNFFSKSISNMPSRIEAFKKGGRSKKS